MAQFPQELIEAVLYELETKNDLKACSLTARHFVHASQASLFRKMALSSSGITTTLCRSHLFLTQHPHLAHHIRDLAIDMPKDHGRQEVLETILKMLQNVERLAINGNILAWDELLSALRSTLQAVISLPSLDCLHILRLSDIPSSLILHFSSSVRVLSMNRVLPSRHKDHSLSNSTPRVEHLILPRWMTTHALLQVCDFLLEIQTLHRLQIEATSIARYHYILAAASAANLSHLELECGALPLPLELPYLPGLRYLNLIIESVTIDSLRTLPANLGPASGQLSSVIPLIETIALTILLRPLFVETAWDADNISALPILGTSEYRQAFPRLRSVQGRLGHPNTFARSDNWLSDELKKFVEVMKTLFPTPLMDGILTWECVQQPSRMDYFDLLP